MLIPSPCVQRGDLLADACVQTLKPTSAKDLLPEIEAAMRGEHVSESCVQALADELKCVPKWVDWDKVVQYLRGQYLRVNRWTVSGTI